VARLAAPAADVVDVTGAGDALIAATLLRIVGGHALEDALRAGLHAAALTTEVGGSVRRDLSEALLQAAEGRIGSATND
jgi:pseudouridine kinase